MKVIMVSAKAQSGKDTFCDIAVEKYGAVKIPFAGALKEEVAGFLERHGISYELRNLWGSVTDKEEEMHLPTLAKLELGLDVSDQRTSCTYRWLLQYWGTEYRRSQDKDYWVKRTIEKFTDPNGIYVVSDGRFVNEANAIKAIGGKLVRINRPNRPTISGAEHPSETGLDNYDGFDFTINNKHTLTDFKFVCNLVLDDLLDN